MTQSQDDAIARAARLLAGALSELQNSGQDNNEIREELSRNRIAIESLAQRLEQQLVEDRQQRALLAGQLTNLASSLDRLVSHLEGLSHLMAEMVERMATQHAAQPAQAEPQRPAEPTEPTFRPGGEGIALGIGSVPGFQVLMDIQKALMGFEQVASASVERFQEGDSRIQLHLRAPLTASEIAATLGRATGHAFAVEESRPELMRLRLKIVS